MSPMVPSASIGPDFPMVGLVNEEFNILPILSRFSIPLGFGSKTIAEVCNEAGIDIETFLLIVNFSLSGTIPSAGHSLKQAIGIVDFLHNSHEYFLGYKFPHIRANLVSSLDDDHSDINPAIIQFFDEYVEHVRNHFDYEEKNVWPYIRSLASPGKKEVSTGYSIETFRSNHEQTGEKLADLKNIILRYYTTSMPNRMYDALVDIFNCEADLNSHHDIENLILVPMVEAIEGKKKAASKRAKRR